MATYFRMFDAGEQWLDASGDPYSGGKLYLDDAGTSTNRTSYKDNAGSVAHTNPIVLDSSGRIPSGNNAWVVAGDVKVILHDSADVLIFTQDDYVAQGDNSAAGDGEWVASDLVPTRTANTIFTLPGDNTAIFHVGRRLKLVDSTTVYATITVSAYTTLTTLTVVVDGGTALTASLASLSYSLLNADNTSDPGRPRNLTMVNDGATIKFGADQDVTLTHVHNTGLNLSSAGIINTEVEIISANSGASAGPLLALSRDSANPANDDLIGTVSFKGENNADEAIVYGSIDVKILDVADGAEDGRVGFNVMRAGTLTQSLALKENEIEMNAATIDINGDVTMGSTHELTLSNIGTNTLFKASGSIYSGRNYAGTYVENGAQGLFLYDAVSTTYVAVRIYDTSGGSPIWHHRIAGTVKSEIEANGDYQSATNSYGGTSDERLKEHIEDSGSQWDDIKAMRVRKYSFITDETDAPNQLGVIAQELEASGMAGLVKTKPYTNPPEDGEGPDVPVLDADGNPTDYKSVKYSILYMKAVKALQEAMDRIETLEARVLALET